MRPLAERVCFGLCLVLGRLLRASRYSQARIVREDGELSVRKRRRFYAPLLVRLGGPLVHMQDAGVRVLPQRDWEERERRLYRSVHGLSIRIDADDTLELPYLRGDPLAALLSDGKLDGDARRRAIGLAVAALVRLHRLGFTHGDAMAENVMVDLDAGVAHWFDFETVHDTSRAPEWCRGDDVRALLVTCLVRTDRNDVAGTLRLILDAYADPAVTRQLAAEFSTVCRRPLPFHLGQAPLSLAQYREIARLLRALASSSGRQESCAVDR